MTAPRFNRDFVKAALLDRTEELFRAVWGEPVRAAGKEWRAKSSSALAMTMQGPKRGVWTDHRTGEGGDLFDLIAVNMLGLASAGDDFPRVVKEAAAWAGLSADHVPDLKALEQAKAKRDRAAQIEAEQEAKAKAALVELIKASAQKIEGTPAQAYLNRRGLHTLPAQGMAYAPPLKPRKGLLHHSYAALVVWATDGGGHVTGGQRVIVMPDGSKPPEESRKPSFGAIHGNPARFPAQIEGGPLYIAEGPESALSVWLATGRETWAVFGSAGWKAAPLPMGRQIILCPDRDAEGSPAQIAFAEAVAFHIEAGRNVWIAEAPEPEGSKADLNDTLQRAGVEAVRQALDAAKDARPRPYHPAPEGDRAEAIKAHKATVRGFFGKSLALIKATAQVKREAAELDKEAPDYRAKYRAIRKAARDAFGLDVLPARKIGKAQRPPRVMLTGAQGVGKTEALVGSWKRGTVGALQEATGLVSLCLFPGHDKAAEACRDYIKANDTAGLRGPVPLHLKGRSAKDPARPDREMCLIPEAAEALAKAGHNVRGTLCNQCPFSDQCGYLEQEAELIRLAADPQGVAIFAPHNYAFLPLPRGVAPDLIAFDEGPKGHGVEHFKITLDALGKSLTFEGAAKVKSRITEAADRADALEDELALIRPARIALRDAWQADPSGASVYATLIGNGWTAERFRKAASALYQFEESGIKREIETARIVAQGDGQAFGAKVEKIIEGKEEKIIRKLGRLFQTVAYELKTGQAEPVAITFEDGRGKRADALGLSYVKPPYFKETTPFLHLDGTGDHALAEAIFGPLHLERHRVERNARVIQVQKSFSNQSITGRDKGGNLIGGNVSWQAPALRRDLIAFCHSHPRALVVGNLGVITTLKDEGLQSQTAHFGALRGRNDWEDLDTVILIGREQPSPQAVELIARAFASQAGEPFQSIGANGSFPNYPTEPRPLRMRQGSPVVVKAAHHPDRWADRILSQIRDAEALQAIDRVRPIFKPDPVTVYVLAELCLDLTVDETCTWAELKAGGDRIARTVAQAGFLPLSPREAERLFPVIWKDKRTAGRDLKPVVETVENALQDTAQQVGQNANRTYYLQNAPLIGATLIKYRTAPKEGRRTRKATRALVWGPLSEARAKVEAVTGPLIAFDPVPEWQAVADALDAAEERAAIQAEGQEVSRHKGSATEAPEATESRENAPPQGYPVTRLERPLQAPLIAPVRRRDRGSG